MDIDDRRSGETKKSENKGGHPPNEPTLLYPRQSHTRPAHTRPCVPVPTEGRVLDFVCASPRALSRYYCAQRRHSSVSASFCSARCQYLKAWRGGVERLRHDPVDRLVADDAGATSVVVPRTSFPRSLPRFRRRFDHRSPRRLRLDQGREFSRRGMALDERGRHIRGGVARNEILARKTYELAGRAGHRSTSRRRWEHARVRAYLVSWEQ